jgi:hypothetical protein
MSRQVKLEECDRGSITSAIRYLILYKIVTFVLLLVIIIVVGCVMRCDVCVFQVHAYIIHYLRKQMPYVLGKSEKQKKLLDRLEE